MPIVHVFAMRHGKKDEAGNLTDEGREQVRLSAAAHLMGLRFDRAYSSGLPRATETAEIALRTIGQDVAEGFVAAETGFAYTDLLDEVNYPFVWMQKQIAHLVENGYSDTLKLWLTMYPPARQIRNRVHNTLLRVASEFRNFERDGYVVVGSHMLTAEAAMYPDTTPALKEGDIAYYQIRVDEDGAWIQHGEVLPRPAAAETLGSCNVLDQAAIAHGKAHA